MMHSILAAVALVSVLGGGALFIYFKGKSASRLERENSDLRDALKDKEDAKKIRDDISSLNDDALNDELRL